ncbi:PHOsphatase [Lobosporangium transversale]|uniref:Multiple inositol polyphosphate phosphatase 1 n=1 Tax=Lobosporangium transversale TaxID=64571 RepID=A0A1Y2GP92_9FUNG|nr:histidine phosphatase superfamily [Lobosporangium transversale]KAF9903361.1 PHOsphatase [Lobosporangium transversale]ORZ17467.1 histidine phosphatase superfamily [Lobosporangium transversale]|eukprot:XP_021881854.1 histidine phosphatase superfamily [Lobosporangium transversale]
MATVRTYYDPSIEYTLMRGDSGHRFRKIVKISGVLSIFMVISVLIALLFYGAKPTSSSSDKDFEWIRQRLGTKTPYPHEDRPEGPLKDTPKGYELVQLHLINRHGTRYPDPDDYVSFKDLWDKLSDTTVPGFEWIKTWSIEKFYPAAKSNLLASSGDADLYEIGRRFSRRYKDFLDRYPYDPYNFEFRSSVKPRSSQSAYAFALALFEDRPPGGDNGDDADDDDKGHHRSTKEKRLTLPPSQPIAIYTVPAGIDQQMKLKSSCPKWLDEVSGQDIVYKQKRLYESKFAPQLAKSLSATFGINISAEDASTIYRLCGFEVSIYDEASTWCQMLLPLGTDKTSKEGSHAGDEERYINFLNFEIATDLEKYYINGPGVPFNREMGCKLGSSLVQTIDLVLSDSTDKPRLPEDDEGGANIPHHGHFKFGHSETIIFFSTFLNLYNQSGAILTGNLTAEQYEKREFRSSLISPFSANMAFEVYKPKTMQSKTGSPHGLVRLLVNEKPHLIPGCGSSMFCDWSLFKDILIQRGTGCDFEACCSTSKSTFTVASNVTCPSTTPIVT